MRRNRVSSPNAAKTGAQFCNTAAFVDRLSRGDMLLDILHLLIPSAAVHAKCFETPGGRYVVEAGFDHLQ
jgi:hypothetical protein